LQVPEDSTEPITVSARLLYRKFDTEFLDFVRADRDPLRDPLELGDVGDANDLPIIEIAADTVVFKVGDETRVTRRDAPPESDGPPVWQRWNDYGVGLLLKGKSELKQAAEAFSEVETFAVYHGPLNLARVQFAEGDLDGATESLQRASEMDPPPPSWTAGWLSGVINRQQGNLEAAAASLRGVLETRIPDRGFDFSLDYRVRNELGMTLIDLAQQAEVLGKSEDYETAIRSAQEEFLRVLQIDSENVTAHANLAETYALTGKSELESKHRTLHGRYKPDDNAAEVAVPAARRKYPAANQAAESLVIYDLHREASEKANVSIEND
jgi:tetratricopeptide (TPR) repeat protein